MREEAKQMRVRDKLWLWGHPAGSHNGIYSVPGESRIAPAEAADHMGIPNLLMVTYPGYGPEPPFDQLALTLRSLDRVVWSVVGAAGRTASAGRDATLELAGRMPNMPGIIMDDFFHEPDHEDEAKRAALSLADLRGIRERLRLADRTLDLWVVLYDYQLDKRVGDYLDLCDVVSFWTWEAQNLGELASNFGRFEEVAARQRKVLGCYMWDYGNSAPMPMDSMRRQSEFALDMLQAGRIDGIIFLASCICDLDIDTVEWARGWIAEAGESALR
jgi:hypothetical protein